MQGRLQGKRFDAEAFVGDIAAHGAEACNYLLAVDMEMATLPGFALTSWESGYGDFVLQPDLATLRPMPWLEGTVFCIADVLHHDGSPVVESPRQILRAQLERIAARGWNAQIG
jgi:glutamine synthetase